jgi:gamma-F420-2:alpha-L-glutamate ligase
VAEICNDKARTYQYVAQLGIPMVDSTFYKNERIENIIDLIKFPSVIKAVDGHGGNQVFLIEPSNTTEVELNKKQFIRNQLKCSNIVLQPLVGHKYQDLRVYVIGKTIVAAILRTAKEGFKSNFSLGGEVEQFHLSKEEIKLVKKIIKLFNFGLVGIDFIIGDQGELIFNEIEDVVGARMLYQCTDINLVRLYLNYIKENL